MEIHLPYGRSFLTTHIPDHLGVDIIETPAAPPAANPRGAVQHALENLLGGMRGEAFAGVSSAAIAISDKTRPTPHDLLLPPLLDKLAALGLPASAVTFYVATGSHPPLSASEFPQILPAAILDRFRVVSHVAEDPSSLVYLGETNRRTPVWVHKDYARAGLKIVVGNIAPHQFAGFSGGVKSAAIGLAGLETINRNHALMMHPDAQLGEYATNPARQDIEEIGAKIGIHLALNAILNQDGQIVHALAGDPRSVMQAGVPLSRQTCQVAVTAPYGVIIASPGGHPKDINLYQAQKGLAHAALVTRPGGVVLLAAACPEGTGSRHYEEWMEGKRSYAEILQCFAAEGFRIGPHKAYQIGRDASRIRLLLYSEMEQSLAQALLLNPVSDWQSALDAVLSSLSAGERVGVLPHAASTIPYLVPGSTMA